MSIVQVKSFRCTDGTLFDTRKPAELHQKSIDLQKSIIKQLEDLALLIKQADEDEELNNFKVTVSQEFMRTLSIINSDLTDKIDRNVIVLK